MKPIACPNRDLSPFRLGAGMAYRAVMRPLLRLLFACAPLLAATPALAHSELRSSSPASGARLAGPPAALVLNFNEPVQVTATRLYREGGGEIELPRPRATESVRVHQVAAPTLAPGAYRLDWRIISADGHPVGGAIRFTVTAP
jgi:methionine-rich copper-binding protein CopC